MLGTDDAGVSQEWRAAGGGAGAGFSQASVAALFRGAAPWSDEALIASVHEWVLARMVARGGPITAWIIDAIGFPNKGRHSVGVSRQYCGQLGKEDNCQVAVSLSIANEKGACRSRGGSNVRVHHASAPSGEGLYRDDERVSRRPPWAPHRADPCGAAGLRPPLPCPVAARWQRHAGLRRAMGDAAGIDDGKNQAEIDEVKAYAERIVADLTSV